MSRLRDLPDLSPLDAHQVATFDEFLRSAHHAGVRPGTGDRPAQGLDTHEGRRWLATWRPYIEGQYPGPVEPLP